MTRAVKSPGIRFPICNAVKMCAYSRDCMKIIPTSENVQFILGKESYSFREIIRFTDFKF
jgi:hypothetical protein